MISYVLKGHGIYNFFFIELEILIIMLMVAISQTSTKDYVGGHLNENISMIMS